MYVLPGPCSFSSIQSILYTPYHHLGTPFVHRWTCHWTSNRSLRPRETSRPSATTRHSTYSAQALMSEHRNTSPYSQRRAQTYDVHAAGSSANPYDGVEASAAGAKQTMANRAQSLRHSSKQAILLELGHCRVRKQKKQSFLSATVCLSGLFASSSRSRTLLMV